MTRSPSVRPDCGASAGSMLTVDPSGLVMIKLLDVSSSIIRNVMRPSSPGASHIDAFFSDESFGSGTLPDEGTMNAGFRTLFTNTLRDLET